MRGREIGIQSLGPWLALHSYFSKTVLSEFTSSIFQPHTYIIQLLCVLSLAKTSGNNPLSSSPSVSHSQALGPGSLHQSHLPSACIFQCCSSSQGDWGWPQSRYEPPPPLSAPFPTKRRGRGGECDRNKVKTNTASAQTQSLSMPKQCNKKSYDVADLHGCLRNSLPCSMWFEESCRGCGWRIHIQCQ